MKNYYVKDGKMEIPVELTIDSLKQITITAQEEGIAGEEKISWNELLGAMIRRWLNKERLWGSEETIKLELGNILVEEKEKGHEFPDLQIKDLSSSIARKLKDRSDQKYR